MEFRRKLYARGGSHETTIPKPLLFALDQAKRHDVLFKYDTEKGKWYLDFEAVKDGKRGTVKLLERDEKRSKEDFEEGGGL